MAKGEVVRYEEKARMKCASAPRSWVGREKGGAAIQLFAVFTVDKVQWMKGESCQSRKDNKRNSRQNTHDYVRTLSD